MHVEFEELVGKTITSITGAEKGSEVVIIDTADGFRYQMFHEQDCCESVDVEDIEGDIEDLICRPLVLAEESSNEESNDSYESSTWTFYRLATEKGFVVIRWLGSSNGYYSESVSLSREKIPGWADPKAIWAN